VKLLELRWCAVEYLCIGRKETIRKRIDKRIEDNGFGMDEEMKGEFCILIFEICST